MTMDHETDPAAHVPAADGSTRSAFLRRAAATGAAAETPKVSSIALIRSDSSSTEMLLSSSIHSSVVAMCSLLVGRA